MASDRPNLTDDQILSIVFDEDPASTPAASANDLDAVDFEMAPIPAEVKDKHLRIISLAASGKLDEALPQLVALTQEHPTFAGAFNDLAQTYRLLRREEDAMGALDLAIELLTKGASGTPVLIQAEDRKKVLAAAFTQRAMLRRFLGGASEEADELARVDFERAAALGSEFAKREAAKLHPIAKLCDSMVSQMMKDYRATLGGAPGPACSRPSDGN